MKISTMAFLLLLLNQNILANIVECTNFSGSYKIDLKNSCSVKSYKSLNPKSYTYSPNLTTRRINLATSYESPTHLEADQNFNIKLKIEQLNCSDLKIIFHSETLASAFKYKIEQKNIKSYGFKFSKTDFFTGGEGFFGLFFSGNNIKLINLKNGNLKMQSRDFDLDLFFLLIPHIKFNNPFIDCDLEKL